MLWISRLTEIRKQVNRCLNYWFPANVAINGYEAELARMREQNSRLDAENDRLLAAEVRQLQLALATQTLTAENNRCAAIYWQDEAERCRAVIDRSASRRIADILTQNRNKENHERDN